MTTHGEIREWCESEDPRAGAQVEGLHPHLASAGGAVAKRVRTDVEANRLGPTMLDLGAPRSSAEELLASDYLSRLPRCGALVAFRLCPAAFKLLCGLAGESGQSGSSLGRVGETAGLKSRTTRATALKVLVALGLLSVDRVRGPGGEVRGSRWRILNPPTHVRPEARELVRTIIAQRIERSRRIEGELPGEVVE